MSNRHGALFRFSNGLTTNPAHTGNFKGADYANYPTTSGEEVGGAITTDNMATADNGAWSNGNDPALAGNWFLNGGSGDSVFRYNLPDGSGTYRVWPIFGDSYNTELRVKLMDGNVSTPLATWSVNHYGTGDNNAWMDGGYTQHAFSETLNFATLPFVDVTFSQNYAQIVQGGNATYVSKVVALFVQKADAPLYSPITIIAGFDPMEFEIRSGETVADLRTVEMLVLNADGSAKNDVAGGKAKIEFAGSIPVNTSADFSFVAAGKYKVILTTAEVTGFAIGTKGTIQVADGSGYKGLPTQLTIISNTAYDTPLSSANVTTAVEAANVHLATDAVNAAALASSAVAEIAATVGTGGGGGGGTPPAPSVTTVNH